ncbi:MAG: hypothetical protein K6T83_20465, partial [Alicyclobacillus sp.]|nr:hypothetical protein [Alicyclobacillus sp.]
DRNHRSINAEILYQLERVYKGGLSMQWKPLVYHAVTEGLVQAGDIDSITAGGPDFDGQPDQVIATPESDVDYGVGYHRGRPCLFATEDGGYGYYVPRGFVYEQKYGGYAWEVVTE